MPTEYEIRGIEKLAEQDVFEEGCLPETMQATHINITFRNANLKKLIEEAASFCQSSFDEAVEYSEALNACEETGRLDIQVMEDADGLPASKNDLEKWREGRKKLWAVIYTMYVLHVQREPVDLEAMAIEGQETTETKTKTKGQSDHERKNRAIT